MALTAAQVELIRTSFDLLKPDAEAASETFYRNLFAIAPEVRPLFRGDMAAQGMRFMRTLGLIIQEIDKPAKLEPYLHDLARGHAAYGVKPEHFRPMGQALVETMQQTLGARFPAGADTAWIAAYDHLASEMVRLSK